MADLAVVGVTIALAAGVSLAVYRLWKGRRWEDALMLFFLPLLLYMLWHFSAEAYGWGEVWKQAQAYSNSGQITLETSIAVALVDIKILLSVLTILFWIFAWNHGKGNGSRRKYAPLLFPNIYYQL
jgi:hypothetical protein